MVISHSDEHYRINIRDYLIHRAHAVRVDAKGNLMNLAVLSEDFYAEFLNGLFDLHLKNANTDKQNTAGIDLIDPENHVAVQVSLTCAPNTIREKIRNSIRKFEKPDNEKWQFYFVPITDVAPELNKDFSLPEGLIFDKDHDVLDIARLLTLALDRHKLRPLSQLVNQYSKKESDYQELKESLDRLLRNTWKNHRSFKLMHTDEIDRRLFPGIKDSQQFETIGKRKEGETESPVWSIIRESWKEPENHPIMIEGKGGIGKTVTLFSVNDMDKDLILAPAVYVPMFELIDKNGDIINLTKYFESCDPFSSLPEEQRKGICALATQPWKYGPSLLVLLDGFNEVPGDRRWDLLMMLRKWHTANMGAQLIAVSRPMDNLKLENAFGDSTIAITLSELKRESVAEYLKSLNDERIRLPDTGSPAWDTIIYPLFLTLYIKSELLRDQQLWKNYPLMVRDVAGPGSLIWNYLQRELFRQEDEDWILRCALACEYIVPELAYRMLQKYDYTVGQSEAISIIRNIVSEMDLDCMPGHLAEVLSWWKRQHFSTDLPYYLKEHNWPEFVLEETGLLTPYGELKAEQRYEFFHQSFRDCLAGLYLVNQAETAGKSELPKVWQHGQSHLALDYAAELMDGSTADRLWEINRINQQYDSPGYEKKPSGTYALLELQKRRKPLPEAIDFSGMDIQDLSLTHYMGQDGANLSLFQNPRLSNKTKMNRTTFRSDGHGSPIICMLVLPDGRVVSGSADRSLRVWDASDGRCLRKLEGHSGGISCVAVLSDGCVVSGSNDSSLRVWDASDGQCLQSLKGHLNTVNCVAVLPDGRVVSGSEDYSLQVWDPTDGRCLQKLEGHSGGVRCVVVLPDGRAVSGSEDYSLRVWDPTDGRCLQILEGHSRGVSCVVVLPDGRVVSGSHDGSLRVWDPSDGRCLQTLKGHSSRVNCVAIIPDGRIVSGSADHSLRVWDPTDGSCLQKLEGHSDWVKCVAIIPDGRVVSGSDDRSLRVWDPTDGRCLQKLEGHSDWVSCVAVFPDSRIVSGSNDRSLEMWDPTDGRCLQKLKMHFLIVSCVAVLPDGRIVSGLYDGSLWVWDPSDGRCLKKLEGHSSGVSCVVVLPDSRIVSGSYDGSLRVWDLSDGRCLKKLEGHSSGVICAVVHPDGRFISGSSDCSLRVWDLSDGRCLKKLEGHSSGVSCVAVLSDGRVISGSSDCSLRVWDLSDGRCLKKLEGHSSGVSCVAVLPDGRIVSGSYDGSLRVWDPSDGRCLQTLEGHSKGVSCLAVLPDGRVVSSSFDSSMRVWDPSDGRCLQTLEGHSEWVRCVAVLPDGRVISGSHDCSLRVWDPSDGRCLQTLEGHSNWIRSVAVLPDGRVVSSSDDGTIKTWDLNIGKYIESMEMTEVDVFRMDLSYALLTRDLAKLLWQNGAKISETDFERYVRASHKEYD